MKNQVVMLVKKSAVNEFIEELMDIVIDNKLLVRFCTDLEFDSSIQMLNDSKNIIDTEIIEER